LPKVPPVFFNSAFKRIRYPSFNGSIKQPITEVTILSQPIIRDHPNIIKLKGVFWEFRSETEILPVLLLEKANYGDLTRFLKSKLGKELSLETKLNLCVDIACDLNNVT